MKKTSLKQPISITKIIPSIITLLGLLIGMSAIRFALNANWESAAYCVLVAALFDGIDGKVARFLNATSSFGAELDSLCDFANFGIAPAVMVYLWCFRECEHMLFSWGVVSLYVVCMVIRLARFNTMLIEQKVDKNEKKLKYFSVGVPAPSGALLSLMPMILDFEVLRFLDLNIKSHFAELNIYLIVVSLLLPSRIPTFLIKNIHIKPEYLSLIMILSATLLISVIVYPWYVVPLIGGVYWISLPISYLLARRIL
jgi:CDP-diacylglycerol--serine O-phosphatidyltransferase